MKTAIYVRISADIAGDEHGVKYQERDCKVEVEKLGWNLIEVYRDNDISAASARRRPAYERLLKDIASGRINAVVTAKSDRLYRKMRDLESLVDLVESTGVAIRTLYSGTVDLSTAEGRHVARLMGSGNAYEVERIRERMIASHRNRALDGRHRGGARPFGWQADGLTVEPAEAELIREATARILAGSTVRGICTDWNARGLRTSRGVEWTPIGLKRVVLRGRNAGLVEHLGEIKEGVKGQWQSIIDVDEFQSLRTIFGDKTRRKAFTVERKYQGVNTYFCGKCGKKMQTSRSGSKVVYRCEKLHLSRGQEALDAFVDQVVIERVSDPKLAERLAAQAAGEGVDTVALQAERDRIEEDRLSYEQIAIDGIMRPEKVARIDAGLRQKIEVIDAKLTAARTTSPLHEVALAEDPLVHWDQLRPDGRGKVLADLFSVVIMPIPRSETHLPFNPAYVRIIEPR